MTAPAHPLAVIVGAGPGIGAAVAARLARDGHRVLGTARRQESLDAAAAAVSAVGGTFVGAIADAGDAGPRRTGQPRHTRACRRRSRRGG